MENLKEYFLGLSIHKQIKFGIIVSNTFVCILISGIVIINAFIILTLNYHNLVDILDSQEDKSIDNTAVFFDIETFLVIDTSKEVLVWTRNFMENLQNNKDYLNNLNKKVDVEKVVIPFEKLKDNLNCYKFPPTNCIAIKQFDYGERSKEQIDDYNNYIKVLYMTSFMFEEIFRFRTFRDSTSTIFF